jgi:putative SOS response-associated peptidase YedK
MSSRYESFQPASLYPDAFDVPAPTMVPTGDVWPRKPGVFIRRVPVVATPDAAPHTAAESTTESLPEAEMTAEVSPVTAMASAVASVTAPDTVLELVEGQFGLVPSWVKSASDAKLRCTKLVNARSEAVTTSNNFREAWLAGQRCIVPMMAFIDEDWRSGKSVPTRIARVDGKPMGVAGLWERWEKNGEVIISYTLLTINANSHALMHRYQRDGAEKRMPAILSEGAYGAWLNAPVDKAKEFMRAYPANWLLANPVEQKGTKPKPLF